MDDQNNKAQKPNENVSITVGSAEGAPIEVSGESGSKELESFKEIQSSELEPKVSEDLKDYVNVNHEPRIDSSARDAGITESIQDIHGYTNLPTDQNIALQTVKTADVATSDPWRALIVLKEMAKGLFGFKKQEAN